MSDNEQYPRGKLNADDEGQLQLAVGVQDKTVIVDFGKQVVWLGMDYFTAVEFAKTILRRAKEIAPPEQRRDKPILCIDFDGVIHRYSNGWQGGKIYDQMTDGFIAWAHKARKHFTLTVYSSRSKEDEGREDMKAWMFRYLTQEQPYADPVRITDFEFASEKPPEPPCQET